ncbi:MAG: ABC transporter ATP-binding protein [Pseudomonadota bacterium]
MAEPLLEVLDLAVAFGGQPSLKSRLTGHSPPALRALDGVDLSVPAGTVLGLVGESGSGKTTLGRVLVGLEAPTRGEVRFRGEAIAMAGKPATPRPRAIQMVFQDPYSSLNPRMAIGAALSEAMRVHDLVPREQRETAVHQLLAEVGLAAAMADRRPAALSGGQRQRASLARALAVQPDLLVLDEPVSALDVSIQAQIIKLLDGLRRRRGIAMVFIAHELGVVRAISTHIAVLYLGKIMEAGPIDRVFQRPGHPYTKGLLAAAPRLGAGRRHRVPVVTGEAPSPLEVPSGCRFHPRCPKVAAICRRTPPPMVALGDSHISACHFAETIAASAAPELPKQANHARRDIHV